MGARNKQKVSSSDPSSEVGRNQQSKLTEERRKHLGDIALNDMNMGKEENDSARQVGACTAMEEEIASREEILCLDDVHISLTELTTREERDIRHRGMMNEEPYQRIVIYLQQSRLYKATFLHDFKVMLALISALIQCWRPKTHTFHFPCGDVTITLEDVVYQLGVPINGMPLVLRNNYVRDTVISDLLDVIDGMRIWMTWLEREFRVDEQSTEQEVIYAARAYFMALIGGILLSYKSGNSVQTQYLRVLENFTVCRQYSWDYAILAFCIVNFARQIV
ncbi:protein MAINTENANCE OF MERISTEMS-like [Hibiscus syriacus]|uniref:protein MAINTENANCE OF MERISTEMS-like n=1 Tax=Hibiscus syriacus TaxID=106335 RepID=UPI00192310A5|nr:protein MAINTENANCE OF MERISTEMS-like [Hibiscus syriacus]